MTGDGLKCDNFERLRTLSSTASPFAPVISPPCIWAIECHPCGRHLLLIKAAMCRDGLFPTRFIMVQVNKGFSRGGSLIADVRMRPKSFWLNIMAQFPPPSEWSSTDGWSSGDWGSATNQWSSTDGFPVEQSQWRRHAWTPSTPSRSQGGPGGVVTAPPSRVPEWDTWPELAPEASWTRNVGAVKLVRPARSVEWGRWSCR